MTRARFTLVATLAAVAAACGRTTTAPNRTNFRLPSAVAAFAGRTVGQASGLTTYLAVANEARDDLVLLDGGTDVVLDAPVLLRPLSVTFPGRPTQLVSASLGEVDGSGNPTQADLLVGVAAGSSVLQLVRTWTQPYSVDADVAAGQAIDLGADILAIVPLPRSAVGSARLAVALSGNRLAVVDYTRAGVEIHKGAWVVHPLGFEPAALAVVPGDARFVYAATRDPIGAAGVLGVARIDLATQPWAVTALDARGPTRLVAAARLKEQLGDPAVVKDEHAFDAQVDVPRVYAVLDEAGCGMGHRIDCGIVALDPEKTPAAGDDHIPEDWAGVMPYRAPIPTSARALALAVSAPPARLPSDATHSAGFMRIATDGSTFITTAVAAVALENRAIEFIDLGRFKDVSKVAPPIGAKAEVSPPESENRLWIQDPASGEFAADKTVAGALIGVTPGFARSETWTVSYQGRLPELQTRFAEAWWDAVTGRPVVALQLGDGTPGSAGRTLTRVARIYHPALGVKVGDILIVRADTFRIGGVEQCTGEIPAGESATSTTPKEFETEILAVEAPTPEAPGGAIQLGLRSRDPATEPAPTVPPGWDECWQAFTGALSAGATLKDLLVTVAARDLLLTGAVVGYAGRPQLGVEYALQYAEEDTLAAQCPLADWDGSLASFTPAVDCGGAGCDREGVCEELVLARKARRQHHLSEGCGDDASCRERYPYLADSVTLPVLGPVLRFQVGHQFATAADDDRVRGKLTLTITTSSGVSALVASPGGAATQASGAIAFDRSPLVPDDGYRFLVWYRGNQIADVSPSVYAPSLNVVR